MERLKFLLMAILLALGLAGCFEDTKSSNATRVCPWQNSEGKACTAPTAQAPSGASEPEPVDPVTLCDQPISEEDGWSPEEVWAWNERLCLGLAADMAHYALQQDGKLKPADSEAYEEYKNNKCQPLEEGKWHGKYRLSADFLSEVIRWLAAKKDKEEVYVEISCAEIDGDIIIVRPRIDIVLVLSNSKFRYLHIESVRLPILKILFSYSHGIEVDGSNVSYFEMKDSEISEISISGSDVGEVDFWIGSSERISVHSSTFSSNFFMAGDVRKNEDDDTVGEYCIEISHSRFKKGVSLGGFSCPLMMKETEVGGEIQIAPVKSVVLENGTFNSIFVTGPFDNFECRGCVVSGDVGFMVYVAKEIIISNSKFGENFGIYFAFPPYKSMLDNLTIMSSNIDGYLYLEGVHIKNDIFAKALHVGKGIFLRDGAVVGGQINFLNAETEGNLEFTRSHFFGPVILENMKVGKLFLANDAAFHGHVNLRHAELNRSLIARGTWFRQGLNASNIMVRGDVILSALHERKTRERFLQENPELRACILRETCGRYLEWRIRRTQVEGLARFNLADIGKSFMAQGAHFKGEFSALGIRVGGYVDFSAYYTRRGRVAPFFLENPEIRSCISRKKCREKVRTFGVKCGTFPKSIYDELVPTIFGENVYFSRSRIGMFFDASGVIFGNGINVNFSEIRDSIYLRCGASINNIISLYGMKINGNVNMARAFFDGNINLHKSNIIGFLFGRHSYFKELDIAHASIGRAVELDGARIGEIKGYYADIGRNIFIRGGAAIGDLALNGVKAQMVLFGDVRLHGKVRLDEAEIFTLVWGASKREYPKWRGKRCDDEDGDCQRLDLGGTKVEVLQDVPEAWCYETGADGSCAAFVRKDLQGFRYESFGRGPDGESFSGRPVEWMIGWLRAQPKHEKVFISQPYEQLAEVLKRSGQVYKASEILYEKHNYQLRLKKTPAETKVRLWASWIFVGYGSKWYRHLLIYTCIIMLFFILYGIYFKLLYKETFTAMLYRILYAIDIMIPLIGFKLDENPLSNEQTPMVFMMHVLRIVSYIFIIMLGAVMVGILK